MIDIYFTNPNDLERINTIFEFEDCKLYYVSTNDFKIVQKNVETINLQDSFITKNGLINSNDKFYLPNNINEYLISYFYSIIFDSEKEICIFSNIEVVNKINSWNFNYVFCSHVIQKKSLLNEEKFFSGTEHANLMEADKRVAHTVTNFYKCKFDSKYIDIYIKNNKNILIIARTNSTVRKIVEKLCENDYIYYSNNNNRNSFIKRKEIKSIWQGVINKEIQNREGIYWTIENPGHVNAVVVFSSMPAVEKFYSHSITDRHFTKNNPRIREFLPSDVTIIRIADMNLVYGSYYRNTKNFPDYEEQMIKLLKEIKSKYHNTILYGSSKGGTGALYYSKILDIKSLVCDPIISMRTYDENCNIHYMYKMRTNYFPKKMGEINGKNRKIIFTSSNNNSQLIENNKIINLIFSNNKDVEILDLKLPYIYSHPDVTTKTLNLQNLFFYRFLLEDY